MKLSVVIPVLGQHELARVCIGLAVQNRTRPDTDIVVIDQGADLRLEGKQFRDVLTFVPERNLGVYPTFPFGFNATKGDVVLFIHSDLLIVEKGYDQRIIEAFEKDALLGMIGFVGSNEIDMAGGRGLGTTSNFQGGRYQGISVITWAGSPAEVHGKHSTGLSNAATIDGCAMAIRRVAWKGLTFRDDFPIHHFYDRLISCQIQEIGHKVAVLGIACDHISGQSVNIDETGLYRDIAREWSEAHISPDKWVGNPPDWNWDQTIYQEAERMWLKEYRDEKHFIPRKVS